LSVVELLGLAVAGFLAGSINAVAGAGTLLSFPALVATGITPIDASATSTVGLVPGNLGGTHGYRPELAGQDGRLKVLGAASVLGAVIGAALLLVSSAAVFDAIAPVLILAACGLIVAAPMAEHPRLRRSGDAPPRWLFTGQLAASVYGAYFGAGLGILLLGMFGFLLRDDLQRLNALKVALSLVITAVAGFAYVFSGRVAWSEAAVLAVASLAGGRIGVIPARRLSTRGLRAVVLAIGMAAAIWMFVR
jgi:uncharacterized membrane protein YfcA